MSELDKEEDEREWERWELDGILRVGEVKRRKREGSEGREEPQGGRSLISLPQATTYTSTSLHLYTSTSIGLLYSISGDIWVLKGPNILNIHRDTLPIKVAAQ